MRALEVVVSLWIHPGRVAEFEVYEHKAARIMRRYGGVVQKVVRINDAGPASNGQPFEVHVLDFPSREAFHSYRADSELARLSAERNAAISRTKYCLVKLAQSMRLDIPTKRKTENSAGIRRVWSVA